MNVATLKTALQESLETKLPAPQDIQCLSDETYHFIREKVLPPFDWTSFAAILEKYQTYRFTRRIADIDVFPLAACLAVGGTVAHSLPVAASWTLYVLAGRLFDDLADGEGEESNLFAGADTPTPLSVCLFAHSAANAALWHLPDKTAASHIATAFSQAVGLAVKAEDDRRAKQHRSLEAYFATTAAKTGLILAVGAWAGGRSVRGSQDDEALNALYAYGLHVGMMTQIVDDCLDLEVDLTNQVWTLPTMYGLSLTSHPLYPRLHQLLTHRPDSAWAAESAELLVTMGAVSWSRQLAEVHRQQAWAVIDRFPSDVSYLRYYVTPQNQ